MSDEMPLLSRFHSCSCLDSSNAQRLWEWPSRRPGLRSGHDPTRAPHPSGRTMRTLWGAAGHREGDVGLG
jgi:hypothetical protein